MAEIFFRSLLIGYSGAMMPGSLLTYTIDKSLRSGAKSGLLISIGHALLEALLVILIFVGAGQYLGTKLAQTVIGLAGGLVLAYMGYGMVRDAYLNKLEISLNTGADTRQGNVLVGGAVISASNPYFIFWWAVVGLGLIVSSYKTFGILGVAAFYFGHILADFTWYCFVSALVSRTRKLINIKIYKAVIIVLGICLIGFGLSFIYGSVRNIYI